MIYSLSLSGLWPPPPQKCAAFIGKAKDCFLARFLYWQDDSEVNVDIKFPCLESIKAMMGKKFYKLVWT